MQERILKDDLGKVIRDLTIPGYYGALGMNIFNIIDTYFVSVLGATALAAMSFTFSIVMFVNLITIGLGVGIAALVAKAVGNAKETEKVHYIMGGIIIAVILSLIISIIGLLTIDPFFTFMGADKTTLPLIHEYMQYWYVGCIFLFMSMVGGQMFRGLGDTKTPGNLMILAAVINLVLDPIMIFGLFNFPVMGIGGASLATMISRIFVFIAYYYLLAKKYHVIQIRSLKLNLLLKSMKEIIIVGIPNSLTKIINPIILGILTYILANHSQLAVAGFGIGTKIESLILALAIAIGNTAMAILGQNYGAGNNKRVNEALNTINKFSTKIFTFTYVFIFILAPFIAKLFTNDPQIITIVVLYLRILALSYPFQSIFITYTSLFNVIGHPFYATIIGFCQLFFIIIALLLVVVIHFTLSTVFFIVTLSYILIAIVAHKVASNLLQTN